MCDDCVRLQAENARLRDQIKRAKIVIRKQKKQLEAVRSVAWKIAKAAERALSTHLPRGTWSLWRGRGEVASIIFEIVFIDWTGLVGDI